MRLSSQIGGILDSLKTDGCGEVLSPGIWPSLMQLAITLRKAMRMDKWTAKLRLAGLALSLLLVAGAQTAAAATVYNNGLPNQADGSNMSLAYQAEDFSLSVRTRVTAVHFWTLEEAGAYRGSFFWELAANAGGSPGLILASGSQSVVTRSATGVTAFGLSEFQNDFFLNAAVDLAAGSYWLILHNGAATNLSDTDPQVFWESTANNATVLGRESTDLGATWSTSFIEHAFFMTGDPVGTPTPEPPSVLLLGAALGAMLAARRRSSRKA